MSQELSKNTKNKMIVETTQINKYAHKLPKSVAFLMKSDSTFQIH